MMRISKEHRGETFYLVRWGEDEQTRLSGVMYEWNFMESFGISQWKKRDWVLLAKLWK